MYVVCDQHWMIDRPSQLPVHLVAASAGRRMVLHAMHSVELRLHGFRLTAPAGSRTSHNGDGDQGFGRQAHVGGGGHGVPTSNKINRDGTHVRSFWWVVFQR
ncbi:DUF6928 family protein [Streptomyces sp. NPDC054840]